MTTLAVLPTYPIPGAQFAASFTLTESGTNYVRVWCTAAPDGSELDKKLDETAASSPRVLVYEGDGTTAAKDMPWRAKLDKGGVYTLVAQEYTKGTGFGGGYQDDDRANLEETKVGSEATLSLYIGQRFTSTVGTNPDTAKLVFWVFNNTIRQTTLALHGESTPAVTNPATARAKTAATCAAVAAELSPLIGMAVSTALATSSLDVTLADFITRFNAHIARTTGSTHANADADNAIVTDLAGMPTPTSLPSFVNEALRRLRQHMTNDSGSGVGSATSTYHSPGAVDTADMTNLPLVRSTSSADDGYAAFADLYRAYEAHRVNTAVHGAADNVNSLAAIPQLMQVNQRFLESLASTAPTAAPGETTAIALLKNWGFKEG